MGWNGVMETPENGLVIRKLLQPGWSRQRLAAEPGSRRNTMDRDLRVGEGQPDNTTNRWGHLKWLRERFKRHHGEPEVVRRERVNHTAIQVSRRTVERLMRGPATAGGHWRVVGAARRAGVARGAGVRVEENGGTGFSGIWLGNGATGVESVGAERGGAE